MTPLPNSQQRTLGRRRQFFFDFLSRNLDERSFLLSQLFSLPFPVAKAHSNRTVNPLRGLAIVITFLMNFK